MIQSSLQTHVLLLQMPVWSTYTTPQPLYLQSPALDQGLSGALLQPGAPRNTL